MKPSFIVASILLFISAVGARSVFSAPGQNLSPADVKATLPKGATSFTLQRLPLGEKGTPRLMHVWGIVRPNTKKYPNPYDEFLASPFCVDIFEPHLDGNNRWGWQLATSATYIDSSSPATILTHWLQPSKKQGPVIEIISSNGVQGISTKHTFLVWDRGVKVGTTGPAPQVFWTGGSGGGLMAQKLGTDERGYLSITVTNSFADNRLSADEYRWDGERFAAIKPLR